MHRDSHNLERNSRYESADGRGRRLTVRALMGAILLLAVLLQFCIVPFYRHSEWSAIERRLDGQIRHLTPSDPSKVSIAAWDCARDWTTAAYNNICFSQHHVSTDEMRRFKRDLEGKLRGEVDLRTLIWIWDRLSKTGPTGKQYVRNQKDQFFRCLPLQYQGIPVGE